MADEKKKPSAAESLAGLKVSVEKQEKQLLETLVTVGAKVFRQSRKDQYSSGDWIKKATEEVVIQLLGTYAPSIVNAYNNRMVIQKKEAELAKEEKAKKHVGKPKKKTPEDGAKPVNTPEEPK